MSVEKIPEFSKEIVEFSNLLDKVLINISEDVKIITGNIDKTKKEFKSEVDKLKKELYELKNSFMLIKNIVSNIEKKVKKTNTITETRKPSNNKDETKILFNEIESIKQSIKEIEKKLKMD